MIADEIAIEHIVIDEIGEQAREQHRVHARRDLDEKIGLVRRGRRARDR